MASFEEILAGLSDEQRAKAKACASSKELLELAASEGIELSEKQLEAVSGGAWDDICWTDVVMPDNPTT